MISGWPPLRGSYYFGRALHKRMAADGDIVPIGLVKNEWGGSMIEAWVPETNAITGEQYCTDRNVRVGRTPGKLFNSMIVPVSNTTIKGWLWYQVRVRCSKLSFLSLMDSIAFALWLSSPVVVCA